MSEPVKDIRVHMWGNNMTLQHSGLTRLEVMRMLLAGARSVFFRWDEFKPYEVYTTTGISTSLQVRPT